MNIAPSVIMSLASKSFTPSQVFLQQTRFMLPRNDSFSPAWRSPCMGRTCAQSVSPAALLTFPNAWCRPKYEQLLRDLGVRPLKVQASRGVIVKLTEGSEVEVMGAEEAEAATL